jgi:isochorismate hydrolase
VPVSDQHVGCVERARLILDAKDYWLERARSAETEVDRLRAENERLREAIEAHRSRVLFEAKTEFCVSDADEALWSALGSSQAKGSE